MTAHLISIHPKQWDGLEQKDGDAGIYIVAALLGILDL